MTWSVSVTVRVQPVADQEEFADELEHLFDVLAEGTDGPLPGVSGELNDDQARVNVDLDVEVEDEIGAFQSAVTLIMGAFKSSGLRDVGVIHAELSRLPAPELSSV
jgi:hypothetical protein